MSNARFASGKDSFASLKRRRQWHQQPTSQRLPPRNRASNPFDASAWTFPLKFARTTWQPSGSAFSFVAL